MKRILVGLDGSPRAPGVLAAAVAIARAQGARLILLRSVGLPPDVPQDFWKSTEESFLEQLQRHAGNDLRLFASGIPEEMIESQEVRVGVPWQTLCEVALSEQADLIVVGSHGYAGFDRLLGTTAAKVVNHAHCSVVVVKNPGSDAKAS